MVSIIEKRGNGYRVVTNGRAIFVPKVGPGIYYSPELRGGGGGGSWEGGDVTVAGRDFTRLQMRYVAEMMHVTAQALVDDPQGPRDAQIAVLICSIVETGGIWMYANSSVPESLALPHDRVGSDGLSVGLYQQQSQYGWGTTAELMNVRQSTLSFLGGPDGPRNGASPLGLLDIAYRSYPSIGAAVQAVQISAYPDRYDDEVDVATGLLDLLGL